MRTCLACDIGASGGKLIAGTLADGKLRLREIHRFANAAQMGEKYLEWDADGLVRELIRGLRMAFDQGAAPFSVGVDTWGADYVLLDEWGVKMNPCVCYRDARALGMPEKLNDRLPYARHYQRTGTARQPFNTVYQLMSEAPERIDAATDLLMLPDYLHYRLTGLMRSEYTAASTTGLVNAAARQWDKEVLLAAGIPARLLRPLSLPGTPLGYLRRDVAEQAGFNCRVTLPPSHDTASAFLSVPAQDDNAVFLSSGTWSLIGVETPEAILTPEALSSGFTNEGGFDGGKRFLKNIMGLWIVQCLRREMGEKYDYAQIAAMAMAQSGYAGRFNANDQRLLLPMGMADTVRALIREAGFPAPQSDGQLFAAVLRSLADCYKAALSDLTRLTGRRFTALHIVGGGAQNDTLNQWTADACGLPVYAGPSEGTALGNILSQFLSLGDIHSVRAARQIVRDSVPVKRFDPA